MKGKILFLFAFVFLLFATISVSAITVEFNVTTCDNCAVAVTLLKPGSTYQFVDSFHGTTDAFGKFSKMFVTEEAELKYIVSIKDSTGVIKYSEKIDKKSTSEGVDLYLGVTKPTTVAPVANVSVNSTNNSVSNSVSANASSDVTVGDVTTTDSSTGSTGITANAISDGLKGIPSWIYYVVIGVIIVGALGIYFWRNGFPSSSFGAPSPSYNSSNNEIKSSVSGTKPASVNVSALENQINEAEVKIKEARSQINRMKNQDRIRQMEARLEKERRELEKLRSGED